MAIAAYYKNFPLDEQHYYGAPASSDDWADEVNLTVSLHHHRSFLTGSAHPVSRQKVTMTSLATPVDESSLPQRPDQLSAFSCHANSTTSIL